MACIHKINALLVASIVCSFVHSSLVHAQKMTAPAIAYENRTVLIGAEGKTSGTVRLIDMGPGKMGWIDSWGDKSAAITWMPTVERTGDYDVSAILESSGENCSVIIAIKARALKVPCGGKGWNRVQAGTVHFNAGPQRIQFSSEGNPLRKFFSLEFVRPQVRDRLPSRDRKERADTNWMVAAKYGLMFHWTSQSMPRNGPALSYCDAVRNFDVDRLADTVSKMGAGFVVFTTSHAGFYFPGPNPVIDSILPGRTCPRDLVGDLARALNRHQIRLELYFHPGHDDGPWWQRTHFNDDKSAYFQQWRAIISSIGNRYGRNLAGWWFDDAAFTYYPFNPDWEQMSSAARAGNPDRVVAYNSWILPKLNDFYDVFAGENAMWEAKYEDLSFLPVGGTGTYVGGPQKELQAEITVLINSDWGHFKMDQPIGLPRLSADEMLSRLRDAISRKAVPLLDVEVYQDGTASPETLQLFQAVRRGLETSPVTQSPMMMRPLTERTK